MKRSPGNKKDDPSFKILLARLDGGFETPAEYAHQPNVMKPVGNAATVSRPSLRRGILWGGILCGLSAFVLSGLFIYPRVVGQPTTATVNPRSPQLSAAMASSLADSQTSQASLSNAGPAAEAAASQIVQPRTVRTQTVPVQLEQVIQENAPRPVPQVQNPSPAGRKAVAQASAQQPAAGTNGSAANEPDGPPVPLVSKPSRPVEPERPAEPSNKDVSSRPPDVKLLVAPSQRARAGESTPLAIKVDAAGQPVDRLRVAISGLVNGTALSSGGPKSAGLWHVPVRGIEQLQLLVPATTGDDMVLSLELQDGTGNSLARASTQIIVLAAPPAPPKPAPTVATAPTTPTPPAPPAASSAPPRLSMDEHTAMIERGRLLARNGDIAGARLLFERAADAGSGCAALLLGETYDPDVLVGMGVLGAKGDLAKARRWYAKANDLGIPLAAERLRALAGK